MSLESLSQLPVETVVGASKHVQKLCDAPANVTILSRDEVQLYGWRTLGEALRSVSGMVVTYDRTYSYLGVRGFNQPGDYSGRTLIMVDGHRINDAMYDTAAMDHDFILDMDMVERIEVIRGPGSTLYGNNAFFGVVNVITRRGRDIQGGEVSGSYGTFDSYTGRLTYGNRFTNGVELAVSGSVYGSDGNPHLHYPEFSSVNNGVAENMDDGWARNLFASLSWKSLSFEAGYVDRFKRIPTAQYTEPDAVYVFNDPRFRQTDERAFASLKWEETLGDDWRVMARAYYDHYRYDGAYPIIYEPGDPNAPVVVNNDLNRSESVGLEFQLSRTFFEKHLLTVGGETRYDFELFMRNRDLDPPTTYKDVRENGYFGGVFVQDEFRVLKNLTLTAGARYDIYKIGGDTFNPRAAAVYHPWDPSTIKLLYGQAYRAPNGSEAYYDWPLTPEEMGLEPETVRSYEVVYEHEFSRAWRASAAGFYNDLRNLIAYGETSYTNLPPARALGVETELSLRLENGVEGRASYTFAHAENDSTGERLPNSPEHLGKFNLAVPIWERKLFASAEVQVMSSRTTVSGGGVGAFWVMNATLFSRELIKNLDASVSVYNLFDQKYSDPASPDFLQNAIEQDGRTFRLKLTWKF